MVLRHLITHWLRAKAGEKVRETVVEAAREHVAGAQAKPQQADEPTETPPCEVGFVFALGMEAGGLEDRMVIETTNRGDGLVVKAGRLGGHRVVTVVGGVGKEAAAKATEALVDGHGPELVVSAGFAGGLDPQLKRNDVVLADRLVDAGGEAMSVGLSIDPDSLASTPGVYVGRLLTVEQPVRSPEEKASLHDKHGAQAVDMETFAVAEVCRRRGVPLLCVRVINDPADEQLPPEVENLLQQKTGAARLGAAAGAMWRRPSSIKEMYRLKENALLASERLGKFLLAMFE